MKKNIFLLFFLMAGLQIGAQQLNIPNFAWATHPMKINKIEQLADLTVVELSITNQLASGGSFCANKNIYLMDVLSGKKYYLLYSKGIPVCPDKYEFTAIGEILTFQLYFPSVDSKTKYINIIENCNNYCFSISGIILNKALNEDINLAYQYYKENKLDFAVFAFKKALEEYPDYPFGKFYIDLIQVYVEKNDLTNAKSWYKKLKSSNFIDREEVLHQLQKASFYSQLIF